MSKVAARARAAQDVHGPRYLDALRGGDVGHDEGPENPVAEPQRHGEVASFPGRRVHLVPLGLAEAAQQLSSRPAPGPRLTK